MRPPISRLLLFATFALVTAACSGQSSLTNAPSRTDAEITRNLVGSWKVDVTFPSGTTGKGSVSLAKDGTFTSEGTFAQGDGHISIGYAGTWQVENGVLIETVTNSSHSNLPPVGLVTRDRILRVDNRKFVFKTESGEVV